MAATTHDEGRSAGHAAAPRTATTVASHNSTTDDHEPADPRAADRVRAEQEPPPAPDQWARASLERALARGRLLWPEGPTSELRAWAGLSGIALGGAAHVAFTRARAVAGGLCLGADELLLSAAGYALACPGLVAAHLEQARRAGRVS